MKHSTHYLLKNVRLWNQKPTVCLEVKGGVLQKISQDLPESSSTLKVFDGGGCSLVPAGVDPQVHLRVPGQSEKETAQSGLEAALYGGFGAVLTMPNTKPVIDNVEVCALAKEELDQAQAETGVEAFLSAAITKGQKGKEPVDFVNLAKWGVKAFTDDGVGVVSDEMMRLAFAASCETGLPILQHAEYPGHGGVLAPSSVQEQLHVKAYPAEAESDMVARDVALLKEYPGARYHVLHVSSQKTLQIVENAKDAGLQVTCEASPHHLMFCCDDIAMNDTSFKMNPPLRSAEDRLALRKALASGVCDFVATDHAPHESGVKKDFKTSAYGTTGLESALRCLLTLWQSGELSSERLVAVFSTGPAQFLGIRERFGQIELNKPFNATLVNEIAAPSLFLEKELKSQSKNNCFVGASLAGQLCGVFLENNVRLF